MEAAGGAGPVVRAVPGTANDDRAAFERFVKETGPRLGRALAAAYGFEDGRDATPQALAYSRGERDRGGAGLCLGERAETAAHRQPAGLPVPGRADPQPPQAPAGAVRHRW